jgi:hypothetical protein
VEGKVGAAQAVVLEVAHLEEEDQGAPEGDNRTHRTGHVGRVRSA